MMFRLVLLSGFLGAGKTTTMLAAARLLRERGNRVAVVTND
jgi:G3E family GTPase